MSVPTETRVRLRSACDACSIAKVKCDKKNPCERCQTNGFTCSYSPSRRHGKQSWARRVAEQQQYLHSIATPSASTSLINQFLQIPPPYNTIQSNHVYAPTPPPLPPPLPPSSPPDHIVNASHGENQVEYTSLSGFELGEGLDFLSHWSSVESGVDITSSSGAASISTPATSEAGTSCILERQLPMHDCEAKAFTTLHSLHYCTMIHAERPTMHTYGSPSFSQVSARMPPMDKVLFFNRVAVSTLKELLECPCAQQPHLALLYMTIISKTLFWYRLAVSPQYETMSPADMMPVSPKSRTPSTIRPSSSNSILSNQTNFTGRAVKAKTIQIGIFDLEEEDEKLLMRSVLLREVKKVEGIVEVMKSTNARQVRDEYGDEEQQMSGWYAVGGARLEKEVNDTLREVKEMGVRRSMSN